MSYSAMIDDFSCITPLSKNYSGTTLGLTYFYSGIQSCEPNHYWLGIRDHYIIHFILHGKGEYILSDEKYDLTKCRAFLVKPGQRVKYIAGAYNPWKYCWIGFAGMQAKNLIDKTGFYNSPISHFNNIDEVENTILNLQNLQSTQSNLHFLEISYLLKILSHLDMKKENDKHNRVQQRHLNTAIQFIEHNYSRHILVDDIARHVGIDRKYLSSIFKKLLNTTTQQYLLNKRLDQATILLSESNLSIKEISHSLGYYDALLFSKMFKNKYGLSPTLFRNRIIK